jgi:hypothetical protein
MFLRNVGNHLQHYTTSQPGRPQDNLTAVRKLHVSLNKILFTLLIELRGNFRTLQTKDILDLYRLPNITNSMEQSPS